MKRIESRTRFCHYTSVETAGKILSSHSLQLSRLDKTNDLFEINCHDDANRIFIACFCHSEAKSIPMFYLYSGIDGKGCRIEFTAAKINNILNDATVYPVNKRYNMMARQYSKDSFSVYADWIFYRNRDSETGYHKGKFKDRISEDDYLDREGIRFFEKQAMWRYENEFRIVVCFKEPQERERIAIMLPFNEKEHGISLMCGPETDDELYMEIEDEFTGYGITKISRVEAGRVKMNLVEKNKYLLK